MAPRRKYNLGKRATAVAQTRQTILEGALSAYQELGIVNTSMQEVARRADVAAGTVLYHFSDRDKLVRETMAYLVETMDLPSEMLFGPEDDLKTRIGKLVAELFALWNRTGDWYQFYVREREQTPYLVEVEREFNSSYETWVGTALGPSLREDDQAVRVTMALTSPQVCDVLVGTGFSLDAASRLITEMLVSWLTATLSAGGE